MSDADAFCLKVQDGMLERLRDDKIHHVYPTFGREHVTNDRAECWCQPRVEFVEGGAIIIHEVEQ